MHRGSAGRPGPLVVSGFCQHLAVCFSPRRCRPRQQAPVQRRVRCLRCPRDPVRRRRRWLDPVCLSSLTFRPYVLAGLNYILTADVAKKEKSQLPRVYFVLLGETVGQVSEKLHLAHMEETCHHYVAHVKVSPALHPPPLRSARVHVRLWKLRSLCIARALTSNLVTSRRTFLSSCFKV